MIRATRNPYVSNKLVIRNAIARSLLPIEQIRWARTPSQLIATEIIEEASRSNDACVGRRRTILGKYGCCNEKEDKDSYAGRCHHLLVTRDFFAGSFRPAFLNSSVPINWRRSRTNSFRFSFGISFGSVSASETAR